MSSGYIDKSNTKCSSAASVSSDSAGASTTTRSSLPPKKRRVVHCASEFSTSLDCFDHDFSTFSLRKRSCKPAIEAASTANTNEAAVQRNADALSSLYQNSRLAMESSELLLSLGRCAEAQAQVINPSNGYSNKNTGSSNQQSRTLDYSVVYTKSANLAQVQLQSSHANQSSPCVAAKVALWNAYLKARAKL
jgi:hypothetical protein